MWQVMRHYSWPVVIQGNDGYHRVNYGLLELFAILQWCTDVVLSIMNGLWLDGGVHNGVSYL